MIDRPGSCGEGMTLPSQAITATKFQVLRKVHDTDGNAAVFYFDLFAELDAARPPDAYNT
jgi:hypothetical protein